MAGVMNTGTNPKLLWPGLNKIWGDAYREIPDRYLDLFDKSDSEKNYEEDVLMSPLGLVPVKAEGSPVEYDAMSQRYISRYTHLTYALGFIVTQEAIEDNLYWNMATKGAQALARSFKITREIVGANIYNNGFAGGPTYGDGQVFFSASHPLDVGTASNVLTPGADLSEAALEQLNIQIEKTVDSRGKPIFLMSRTLVVPPELQFEAERILKDPDRPGTADRDINAMRTMGKFPGGIRVNRYLTDADAYFIRTDIKDAVRYFERIAAAFTDDNDFDTTNEKYKVRGRYSFGVTDFRGAFASPGA